MTSGRLRYTLNVTLRASATLRENFAVDGVFGEKRGFKRRGSPHGRPRARKSRVGNEDKLWGESGGKVVRFVFEINERSIVRPNADRFA